MATGAGTSGPVKLLLDELWPPMIAEASRDRDHQIAAVAERPDLRGRPDEEILETTQAACWGIVTENVVDYRPLAAAAVRTGHAYPALVFTSNRSYPRANRRTAGRLVVLLTSLVDTFPADAPPDSRVLVTSALRSAYLVLSNEPAVCFAARGAGARGWERRDFREQLSTMVVGTTAGRSARCLTHDSQPVQGRALALVARA